MHDHRHFFDRLIHDLRRFGGGVIAGVLLLFIFATLAWLPVRLVLGEQGASSFVSATIVWLGYRWVKDRHPGFSLKPRMSRRHAYALLGVGYALTALLAAVLFIIYS